MTRLTKQRFFLLAMLGLTGCTAINPPKDTSTLNKINYDLKQAVTSRAESSAVPEAISSALLPPLKVDMTGGGAIVEQRFDITVTHAQARAVRGRRRGLGREGFMGSDANEHG